MIEVYTIRLASAGGAGHMVQEKKVYTDGCYENEGMKV